MESGRNWQCVMHVCMNNYGGEGGKCNEFVSVCTWGGVTMNMCGDGGNRRCVMNECVPV